MEYENDNAKTLEDRMAQIEKWKEHKDDEEYRAKVKAENEYWEAVNNLKKYHKRIEDICALTDKLYSYNIYPPINKPCVLIQLHEEGNGGYKYYFGKEVCDKYGTIDHYVLYDNGEFYYCYKRTSSVFVPSGREKPETQVLREIYNSFPEFEKKFYDWLDKATKID